MLAFNHFNASVFLLFKTQGQASFRQSFAFVTREGTSQGGTCPIARLPAQLILRQLPSTSLRARLAAAAAEE
jgi:hypothetical protein